MSNLLNKEELTKGIAYHEAGHAIFQRILGFELQGVAANPEQDVGRTMSQLSPSMRFGDNAVQFEGTVARDRFLCHLIMFAQAGQAFQRAFCPETFHPENSNADRRDIIRDINMWNRPYATRAERAAKIDELAGFTAEITADVRCVAAAHALANALMVEVYLSGDRAGMIIDDAIAEAASRLKIGTKIACPHCVASQSQYDEFENKCREDYGEY